MSIEDLKDLNEKLALSYVKWNGHRWNEDDITIEYNCKYKFTPEDMKTLSLAKQILENPFERTKEELISAINLELFCAEISTDTYIEDMFFRDVTMLYKKCLKYNKITNFIGRDSNYTFKDVLDDVSKDNETFVFTGDCLEEFVFFEYKRIFNMELLDLIDFVCMKFKYDDSYISFYLSGKLV